LKAKCSPAVAAPSGDDKTPWTSSLWVVITRVRDALNEQVAGEWIYPFGLGGVVVGTPTGAYDQFDVVSTSGLVAMVWDPSCVGKEMTLWWELLADVLPGSGPVGAEATFQLQRNSVDVPGADMSAVAGGPTTLEMVLDVADMGNAPALFTVTAKLSSAAGTEQPIIYRSVFRVTA